MCKFTINDHVKFYIQEMDQKFPRTYQGLSPGSNINKYLQITIMILIDKKDKQAGAELGQAQHSLS